VLVAGFFIFQNMKLTLSFRNGSLAGKSFNLSEGFFTFGRSEKCNVRFATNERITSSEHAYLQFNGEGFVLTDNLSMNGTFVNGAKIQKTFLRLGDIVQFGTNGIEARIDSLELEASNFDARNEQLPNELHSQLTFSQSISTIGISEYKADKIPKTNEKKYIGFAIGIFAIVFLSLIVLLLVVSSIGFGTAVLAAFVAFIPAVLYILPLVWLDRYDPEPFWLLALAFAWGALVSVIFSAIVNDIFALIFGPAASAVISAPIFEEGSKGLGLVLILLIFRREFDDILDGIIYAGVIALGFATVENVLYYGRGINEGGTDGLLFLFLLRGIMSPFAHVTFTAMTGIGCGISRESHNILVRFTMPIVGYFCAVFLHMLWNGMAVVGGLGGFIVGYLILEIPFFLIFLGFSFFIMRRQNRILKESLAIDVARGLISQDELNIVTSSFKSFFWAINSKFVARRNFVRSVGKLGLSYWHIQRATAAQGQTASFQQNPILRDEVLKWKAQI
jgi:protease PrsW